MDNNKDFYVLDERSDREGSCPLGVLFTRQLTADEKIIYLILLNFSESTHHLVRDDLYWQELTGFIQLRLAGYFGKQDYDDKNVMYALERLKECELIDYQITEDKKIKPISIFGMPEWIKDEYKHIPDWWSSHYKDYID
ncbi:hypothetical protein FDC45_19935 [Clostridium botulinum]|uniref:Uncharacterized protein n=1 Tax=Clostridium botulinum TaxID=1491 RepID=A0A846J869_CLOBO|nr:hypothetical protein [Clostridium botulinum]ACA57513.1 hypothetical protein CLK_A0288 [Clostridium botulinum A3 str. Loch Maree]NFH65493.1 hypothetical protein [Clostridium botulinum]NFJ09350.1 hypothetical protein [Clostridium botulinum]NFK16621.1 hypothetical protein [Clostridium botulinum]NFM94346.1 hypothetical protein [Clostridium botulinum]